MIKEILQNQGIDPLLICEVLIEAKEYMQDLINNNQEDNELAEGELTRLVLKLDATDTLLQLVDSKLVYYRNKTVVRTETGEIEQDSLWEFNPSTKNISLVDNDQHLYLCFKEHKHLFEVFNNNSIS